MRYFRVFPLVLWVFLTVGCDDGSGKKKNSLSPSLDQSTISIGTVRYLTAEPAGFDASVTVHVVDESGASLAGITVMPVSDRENDSFEPATAVTDAEGNAAFHMHASAFGTALVSAIVSTDAAVDVSQDPALSAQEEAIFDVSIQVVPLEASYTWEKGDFMLRATLSDATGPVADASLDVSSPDSDLSFAGGADSAAIQTSTSGSATFHVFSGKIGNLPLNFQLAGVEGSKTVNVPFEGPSAGGTVYMGQPYPAAFVSARAAAFALNLTSASTFDTANPLLGEVTSESVCPCPEPSAFQLRLPIMPPDELLIADPVRQIRYNYFPIVVYDDLNNDHLWSSGETLLGARMNAGVLYYAKPDGNDPQGPLGWSLVAGLAVEPQVLDWEFFKSSLDAWVRRSPLEEIHLHGSIEDAGTANRILFAMVDPSAMNGYAAPGPWLASMIDALQADPAHMLPILDAPIPTPSGTPYELTLTALQLTNEQANNWPAVWTSPQGNPVRGIPVAAFLYEDANGNMAYDAGEPILGTLRSGAAGTSLVIYYVKDCNNYEVLLQPETLGVHRGFNLLETAFAARIRQVSSGGGSYSFSTDAPLSTDIQNAPFKIMRNAMTGTPVATGTITIQTDNSTLFSVPNANCQNCSAVQDGDWFVLTQPHDPPAYILRDWTELDFYRAIP